MPERFDAAKQKRALADALFYFLLKPNAFARVLAKAGLTLKVSAISWILAPSNISFLKEISGINPNVLKNLVFKLPFAWLQGSVVNPFSQPGLNSLSV